jgi:hypothetical protein
MLATTNAFILRLSCPLIMIFQNDTALQQSESPSLILLPSFKMTQEYVCSEKCALIGNGRAYNTFRPLNLHTYST